jgi:glutathione reductase (NADPH)
LLVYASQFADDLAHASDYGWTIEGARFDWPALRDAARDVDRLNAAYRTLDSNKVDHFLERAEITGPNSVRLKQSGRTITAGTILVATGAWPVCEFPVPSTASPRTGVSSRNPAFARGVCRAITRWNCRHFQCDGV